MKKILFIGLLQFVLVAIYAQHDHHAHDEGANVNHILACRDGVNFVEGLPAPPLMEGIGYSDLKISTDSPLAQQYFSQGVCLLHCFWDFEAYRAFKEAIRLDSNAIMPYWGMLHTLTFINNKEFDADKDAALQKIKSLLVDAEGYEALYAGGIIELVETEEAAGYKQKLEYIVHENPDDTDAKLFLAIFNMEGYDADMNPKEGNMFSEYLLRDLLRTDPDNAGVHHYWIHQMENCCPMEAMASAEKLASLAPASGHIVHMPGHIYYKTGDYKRANDQFIASMKVDSAYMADQGISEVDNWNYIHNLNYLLANCAQNGRYDEGLFYAERLKSMVPMEERIDAHKGAFFYQGILVPGVMEMRFGFWDRAIERFNAITNSDSLFGKPEMDYKNALTLFSEGMLAIENDDANQAESYLNKLDALLWRNSLIENKDEQISAYWISFLKVASEELLGNVLIAQGETERGIDILEGAALMEKDLGYSEPPKYPRPVLVSLGTAYTKLGRYDEAVDCYNRLLLKHPNSAMAYWGLMEVYDASKQKEAFKLAEANFIEVTQYGQPEVFR